MTEAAADFNHTRSDIDPVTTRFMVKVPKNEFSKVYNNVASSMISTVEIKGFRKGKAPVAMVKKLYGDRIQGEAAKRVVSQTLYQALLKEDIQETVGEPELSISKINEDSDFEYTATVFLPPKPEITGYDKFDIEIEEQKVADEQVQNAIDEIRSSKASTKTVAGRDQLQVGDILKGRVLVSVEGEKEQNEEPLVVKLGANQLPIALEEGLIGLKIGETKDISSTIEDTHRDENLRGKAITYKVSLEEIQEQVLPELTDDFVASVSNHSLVKEAKTVLELRLKVREELEKQAKDQEQTAIQAEVVKAIQASNPFPVPQIMIDNEIRGLMVQNGFLNPEKINVHEVSMAPFREHFGPAAEERVRIAIIIERIADQEKIEFTDEDARTQAKTLAEEHGLAFDEVERILLADGSRKAGFIRENRFKKTLDLLCERAKVKKVKSKPKKEEVETGDKK